MSNLTLKNVTYKYKGSTTPAVSDVSCTFEPATVYAVIGPSGSGKTTILTMLSGLNIPTKGKVAFDDKNLASLDLDRYRREYVAMIFQAFQLLPLLTAIENVCYPMELCGVKPSDARRRAEKLLESVGIAPALMNRFPSNLSGGEQQRVAIARSLAAGARILLADEPTGNLDVENKKNIMEILVRLSHEEGYCVVIVTHDLGVAKTADVIYRMKDGNLTKE